MRVVWVGVWLDLIQWWEGGEGSDHQATNLIRYDLNKCWSGIRCPLCALGGRQLGYLWWGQIGFRTPELHFLIHGKYETLFNSVRYRE